MGKTGAGGGGGGRPDDGGRASSFCSRPGDVPGGAPRLRWKSAVLVLRGWVKACFLFAVKARYSFILALICYDRTLWNWTFEPMGFKCNHKPLPANNSGLKVLVYAMGKTGTVSISRTLSNFYRNTYHSEDVFQHIWTPLVDEFYQRPDVGGGMFPCQRLATNRAPARMGGSFRPMRWAPEPYPYFEHSPGPRVQRNTPRFREEVARRLSMCRAETLTLDGIENLFWDIYAVSPEAKVIMLNWRKYEEQQRSHKRFSDSMGPMGAYLAFVNVGQHVLPYNALVLPLWDALTGNTLLHSMGNGTRTAWERGSKYLLFRTSFGERRFMQHPQSGMGLFFPTKKLYEEFWELGKRRIPKERLLEFSMKNGTMRELCDFLEIKDNARCDSGRLPQFSDHYMEHERQHPGQVIALWPYCIFCHWFSYKVVWWLVGWPVGIGVRALLKVFPKREHE